MKDLLPVLEQVAKAGPAAADHRRGRRRRGARDAGGEQAARHPQRRGGEGARLRRPPQGHARGHRDAHRRPRLTEDLGIKLENLKLEDLGRAKKVTDRQGPDDDRRRRGSARDHRRPDRRSCGPRSRPRPRDYDREKLQERLAKMVGGVAIIKVGAATESEHEGEARRASKTRMHATKAAIDEGIVPGGGVALLRAAAALADLRARRRRTGWRRHHRAARSKRRCDGSRTNAGHEGAVVVARVKTLPAAKASTPRPRSTRIWWRRASSIPPRWSARRCRTPRRLPRCC